MTVAQHEASKPIIRRAWAARRAARALSGGPRHLERVRAWTQYFLLRHRVRRAPGGAA